MLQQLAIGYFWRIFPFKIACLCLIPWSWLILVNHWINFVLSLSFYSKFRFFFRTHLNKTHNLISLKTSNIKYAYKIHNWRSPQQDNQVCKCMWACIYYLWHFLHICTLHGMVKTEKKIKFYFFPVCVSTLCACVFFSRFISLTCKHKYRQASVMTAWF